MRCVSSAVVIAVLSVWLAGCSHATQSSTSAASAAPGSAAPGPAASRHPLTRASAPVSASSPLTSPSPSPGATATPLATPPRLTNKVPRVPPDAAPRILAVAVSQTVVHPGDTVSGSVVTTSNVASVQARIGGYAVNLSKIGVGRFALTYTVGPLPWFVRGNFSMQVIARNTRGDSVERTIPLTVR